MSFRLSDEALKKSSNVAGDIISKASEKAEGKVVELKR